MENKETKKVEEVKSTQEENQNVTTYKKIRELSVMEIKGFPTTTGTLLKSVSKKTGVANYSSIFYLMGLELRDKKFNADKFLLVWLEKKRKMEDLNNSGNGVSLDVTVWYRPIKGKRKDNDEYFYGVDCFITNSYRVRIFFNDDQLKILRIQNINLDYVEVESEEEGFDEEFE